VRLLGARVRGSAIEVTARAGEAGTLEARAALVAIKRVRLRPGSAGLRLRPRSFGHTKTTVTGGRRTLRLALSPSSLRALAHARRGTRVATVEVAVALRTTGRRTTSQQRRFRVR
jgi:hypothetical protein